MVFTPFVCPTLSGRRMMTTPAVVVSASVRTAEMAPTGIDQQASTETAADVVVAKTVCAAGKYSPAALKSMDLSSSICVPASSFAMLLRRMVCGFRSMHTRPPRACHRASCT